VIRGPPSLLGSVRLAASSWPNTIVQSLERLAPLGDDRRWTPHRCSKSLRRSLTSSFQERPATWPNFVIVEVSSLPQEWIQATGGGQTAIGCVTATGGTTLTLKLLRRRGTPTADWFARLKKGGEHLDDRRLVHGVLTYDFFSMIRARRREGRTRHAGGVDGGSFPAGAVVLGPTQVVSWASN
jgi:hypothetical protein